MPITRKAGSIIARPLTSRTLRPQSTPSGGYLVGLKPLVKRCRQQPQPNWTTSHPLDKWLTELKFGTAAANGAMITLDHKEMFGRLVRACMTAHWSRLTIVDVGCWLQDDWEGVRVLTAAKKHGLCRPRKLPGLLKRAWECAQKRIRRTRGLPSAEMIDALRSTIRAKNLLAIFDDMADQMRGRYKQKRFVYPVRPAAERLGVDISTVSRWLSRLRHLGVCQYQRGDHYDPELYSGDLALASLYWFIFPAHTPLQHKDTPGGGGGVKPVKSTSKLDVMKALNEGFDGRYLTYLDVEGMGWGAVEWRQWKRHLDQRLRRMFVQHLGDYVRSGGWPDAVMAVWSAQATASNDPDGAAAEQLYLSEVHRKKNLFFEGRTTIYGSARLVLTA